jgi:glycerophosphoryl diester phosphodiesterase
LVVLVAGFATAGTKSVAIIHTTLGLGSNDAKTAPITPTPTPTTTPTPLPTTAPTAAPTKAPTPKPTAAATPKPLPQFQIPRHVAHAGGTYLGKTYTNSIAALNHNYALGHRLFEVDLNLTTDGEVVLIHDWAATMTNVFGISQGQRTLQALLDDTDSSTIQPAHLADLASWARTHPSARIILDFKTDQFDMAATVAAAHPDLKSQLIPTIYRVEQYQTTKSLGFTNVTLLTYGEYSSSYLLSFAKTNPLYSISMPPAVRANQSTELFYAVPVFVFTINNATERSAYFAAGAWGVVTDTLGP